MLSVHYRLLTMTHQSKPENLDWYVMCYLEYGNNNIVYVYMVTYFIEDMTLIIGIKQVY